MGGIGAALLGALIACHTQPAQEVPPSWPAAELREGGSISGELAAGESRSFELPLPAATFLRLVVEQSGVDVEVSFRAPKEPEGLHVDLPIENRGRESILAVTAEEGLYRLEIRGFAESPAGAFLARIEALRPATAADRESAETYRQMIAARAAPGPASAEVFEEARQTWRRLGERALETEALFYLAEARRGERNFETAAMFYAEAAKGFAGLPGQGAFAAFCRLNHGTTQLDLGRAAAASGVLQTALDAVRLEGLRGAEAQALHGLGQAKLRLGELQEALDYGEKALALWPPDDRDRRPQTLHQLGVLYARRFHDRQRGRELLEQAAAAYRPDHPAGATTLSQLGRLSLEEGRFDEARTYFERALALRQGHKDQCPSVILLARLAQVATGQHFQDQADAHLAAAREVLEDHPCPRSRPVFEGLAGELAAQRGNAASARDLFYRAEQLYREQGDPLGAAESLAGLARAERGLGRREAALTAIKRAIEIFEKARPTVLREDLRTSFFSAGRQHFDTAIAMLLETGRFEEAFVLAERSRARSLRDLLEQSPAPWLGGQAKQERELLRQLNELEFQRLRTRENQPEKLSELSREVAARVAELERLRGERQRSDPRYDALTHPPDLELADIDNELLADGTTLLEYQLGEETSALWVLRRGSLQAFVLPPRGEIEELAGQALAFARSLEWPKETPPPLCELSRLLLGPARLTPKTRLLLVPDGALAAFPWAALPVPDEDCGQAPPLVENHEIVYLPSVEALLSQRRSLRGRRPAPRLAAIFADPTYRTWPPLPHSATEAAAIAAQLTPGDVQLRTGLAATRENVLAPELAQFRILHFAAHAQLEIDQPLLSALVLAQRGPQGQEVEGTLRAHEIYGLDLPAELVVLSACETGLGREVPGEGLVSGLPRAFLAAGARRVLVSLWPVGDRETAELMTAFYRLLAQNRLPPGRALQEAQLELRRLGHAPRSWAGFVLLGDFAAFGLDVKAKRQLELAITAGGEVEKIVDFP